MNIIHNPTDGNSNFESGIINGGKHKSQKSLIVNGTKNGGYFRRGHGKQQGGTGILLAGVAQRGYVMQTDSNTLEGITRNYDQR